MKKNMVEVGLSCCSYHTTIHGVHRSNWPSIGIACNHSRSPGVIDDHNTTSGIASRESCNEILCLWRCASNLIHPNLNFPLNKIRQISWGQNSDNPRIADLNNSSFSRIGQRN